MNMHVIGNQTLIDAFELIGILGHVPEPGTDLVEVLFDLADRCQAELVLVQTGLTKSLTLEFLDELPRRHHCLVMEGPDINQPPPDPAIFRQAIQRAIGASR